MKDEEARDYGEDEEEFPPDSDERLEGFEEEDVDLEEDLVEEEAFDTQHGEGHTFDPYEADDQGLTYTPPTDPPIMLVDEDETGVEIAAGFAQSMEEIEPSVEDLPENVKNNDLDIQQNIEQALRYNSETMHLNNVHVEVTDGIVTLTGTVPTMDDLGLVYEIVYDMEGVVEVRNDLETEA
jgi:alkanesulfonate monooxygenase SsuD/methylene tetrahydromethanopterin reductase-like flavin-dependent oxidoreductase (luciferase family)